MSYESLKSGFGKYPNYYIKHWCNHIRNFPEHNVLGWNLAKEFVIIMDQVLCENE